MAHRLERLKRLTRARPVQVLLCIGAIAVLALGAGLGLARHSPAKDGGQAITIAYRPFAVTLGAVGTVVPGASTAIVAPFDSEIRQLSSHYGDIVHQGQPLLLLDISVLLQDRREALSAVLKASQAEVQIRNWPNGTEAAKVRRAWQMAQAQEVDAQRRLNETQALYEKGLVARDECEQAQRELENAKAALSSSQEDLDTTLAHDKGPERQLVSLDLDSARARLQIVDAKLAKAAILAPATGTFGRPQPEKEATDQPSDLHLGQKVSEGQTIGFVATPGDLAIALQVNESDISQVKVGQPVHVSGPGFGGGSVNGTVASISGEATLSSGDAKVSFPVLIKLDKLAPNTLNTIRIGMSANVDIVVYNSPSALVLPSEFLRPDGTISVKDKVSGNFITRSVTVGRASPDGIEILNGLAAGDTVRPRN